MTMTITKRSKNDDGETWWGKDETREELALGAEVAATQGEEDGPNKKTRVLHKKKNWKK